MQKCKLELNGSSVTRKFKMFIAGRQTGRAWDNEVMDEHDDHYLYPLLVMPSLRIKQGWDKYIHNNMPNSHKGLYQRASPLRLHKNLDNKVDFRLLQPFHQSETWFVAPGK